MPPTDRAMATAAVPWGCRVRAVGRAARLLAHVLHGLWTLWRAFPRADDAARAAHVQRWSQKALDILGVRWFVHGPPPARGPLLVVANHISWMDILVVNAVRPCRFVSKADVRHWPVLGRLVAGAGTLFIERASRRDALRVVHQMAERLHAGDVLAVFPEGTTSDGRGVLPFHANLLQAALATGSPALPLGIAYRPVGASPDALQRHDAPVYVGDDTLIASLWRVLTATDLCAHLHWGEPQRADGRDRRTWASDLRGAVATLAGLPPPNV